MTVISIFNADGITVNIVGTILQFVVIVPILGLTYALSKVIYNLYFHPLAKFPGPKYAAVSNTWYAFAYSSGRYPFILENLHKKYGPVVRYAPNDLSFATPQAYQDIHGHIKKGKQTFLKAEWYEPEPGIQKSIITIRDPIKHREARKNLSHAFSAKALRTQSDVIIKYVDMWMLQIKKLGNVPEGINMEEWYNWLTFDVIGELAFGVSFRGVERAETHPWVVAVKESLHALLFTDLFRRVPLLGWFPWILRKSNLVEGRKRQLRLSHELVLNRMKKNLDQNDFFSHFLSEKQADKSEGFLTINVSALITAGSETTATFFAGTTYYLLNNPHTLQRLCQEVRSAFTYPEAINGDTTQALPYLFGVMEEGLRIFPPVPAGMHRKSPGAEVDGYYVPPGATVSTSGWSTTHTEAFFKDAKGFHPERWLPHDHEWYEERFNDDIKEASKPFNMGPRVCLGINMAYLEMKIVLARLALEFDWELISKEVDWERDIVLKQLWQKPQLNVRFKPRNLDAVAREK